VDGGLSNTGSQPVPSLRNQNLILHDNAFNIFISNGRAIAQAVSQWLPTEAAWVRSQIR
jgi:hypothetical protein